jgi:hypothetical protein
LKAKLTYLVLAIVVLSCFLVPGRVLGAVAISPLQGPYGTIVTVSGLTPGQVFLVSWDSYVITSTSAATSGTYTFVVPDNAGGPHIIEVRSPVDTVVLSGVFTIMPIFSVSPTSGIVGTSVNATGKGFGFNETNIMLLYDGVGVSGNVTAGNTGSWWKTFIIPVSAGGNHTFDAVGSFTSSANVTDQGFIVKPIISMSPFAGPVGTSVTVSGSGFGASETGITITMDTKAVSSGITANAVGSWTTTFAIPASPGGSRIIDVFGNLTPAANVADLTFNIASGISVDKSSVRVGDTISISGLGFAQNEPGIFVTFDSNPFGSSFPADANGLWTVTRAIPPAAYGTHTIDAYGTITSASVIADKMVSVSPQAAINPTSGNVGDTVNVSGNGFVKGSSIKVNYASIPVITDLKVDAAGSFAGSFKAPAGISGNVTVTLTDGSGITMPFAYAMDSTSPPVPQTITPENGATIGFVGDAVVDFSWSPVSDNSGVTYDFQVSIFQDFNASLIDRKGLTDTTYISSENETLAHGEYFWRVRAEDAAGNISSWSTPAIVKAGALSVGNLVLIIVAVIVLLIGIRIMFMLRKK